MRMHGRIPVRHACTLSCILYYSTRTSHESFHGLGKNPFQVASLLSVHYALALLPPCDAMPFLDLAAPAPVHLDPPGAMAVMSCAVPHGTGEARFLWTSVDVKEQRAKGAREKMHLFIYIKKICMTRFSHESYVLPSWQEKGILEIHRIPGRRVNWSCVIDRAANRHRQLSSYRFVTV